jgi:hypothetical protein
LDCGTPSQNRDSQLAGVAMHGNSQSWKGCRSD